MDNNPKDKHMSSQSPQENMLEKYVQVVTTDGRVFVGIL